MNRDGLVVETDVDHQMKDDERTLIAHDPDFVQPAVDPVTEFFIKLNPAETGSIIVPALTPGLGKIILSLDFTVPVAPPGFQYQIVTFATWTALGISSHTAGSEILKQVAIEFTLVDPASRNSTISRVPFDAPGFAPSVSDSMNAEDHFLPIGPGTQIPGTAGLALLFAKNLLNNAAAIEQASILVTLKLIKIPPRVRIALPLKPNRGNQVSIVASNVNVDVFGPLTADAPATKVASIVAGERIDAIFTGVQDQSLSAQWQIGLLNPSGGPKGPVGAAGDTIIGPIGPKGPTGPTGPDGGPSLADFISVAKQTNETINANADMVFDDLSLLEGPTFAGATVLITNFIPQRSGVYNFNYYVRGVAHNGFDALDYSIPIQFALFESGVEVPGTHSTSEPNGVSPSSAQVVTVVTLTAGLIYTLRNVGPTTSLQSDGSSSGNARIFFGAV